MAYAFLRDKFRYVSIWSVFAFLLGWAILVTSENLADEIKIKQNIGTISPKVKDIVPVPALDCVEGWSVCEPIQEVKIVGLTKNDMCDDVNEE